MGILYIVATPIGNLKDVTLRALEVLKEADLILAEDTRVAKKLLSHYQIGKPVERYDDHARPAVYEKIKKLLQDGKKMALVSDAGTPAISDPGAKLVSFVRNQLPTAKIVPIPGACAIIAALSVAGLVADQFIPLEAGRPKAAVAVPSVGRPLTGFTFLGYPPHKKGRQTFFRNLKNIEIRPIVFYESPHRVQKAFQSLAEVFGEDQEIIVARELTKIHEEIWQGSIADAEGYFQGEKLKGEFVVLLC